MQNLLKNAGLPGVIMLAAPACQQHVWLQGRGPVSHMLHAEQYDGLYPLLAPPEYPVCLA